ncbi:hypothetical protein BH11PLA2_BH11PLA2_31700 [soil metagenome]
MTDANRYRSLSDKQFEQVHVACESFERALEIASPIRIEDHILTVAAEIRTPLFHELLAIELEWHLSQGTSPYASDYRDRFPDRQDDIDRLFHEVLHLQSDSERTPGELALETLIGGRYTLLELIGEGGMGSVYLASQTEPVRRQVALKLIKSGMDSKAVQARFEVEQQALALMDHPNIARVYDGGTADSGQPFFVMELVHGMPITRYCDDRRLTVKARLELFIVVCHAVQHAHTKGMIHRDLKPGNVLVTEVDGRPTPKVIDFGVAQLIEPNHPDPNLATTPVIVGTTAYMSPEQADPSSDVDTRTDIYSLGMILFEMMVGSSPFAGTDFPRGSLSDMIRIIRESDSSRPSTQLSKAEDLAAIAVNRNIPPAKLLGLLKSDLDWIILKTLQKDRTQRYETANALARDIERYLADELVEARPPSTGYRLKKFFKRQKGQVIATSLLLAVLLAGITGTTFALFEARKQERAARDETLEKEAARANEARERGYAEAIANFVEKDFLALTSVEGQQRFDEENSVIDKDSTLRTLLDRAANKLDARTDLDPRTEAKLRWMIGVNYRGLGDFQRAIPYLERSVALHKKTFGEDDLNTLKAQSSLAFAYRHAGQFESALSLSKQILAQMQSRNGPDSREALSFMREVAWGYRRTGQLDKAVGLFEEILEKSKANLGPEAEDTLVVMYNLALAHNNAGQLRKALPLLEETLALQTAKLGPDHHDTHASFSMLASFYSDSGQMQKALPMLEQNLEWSMITFGADHPTTLIARGALAGGYRNSGQLSKAVPYSEQTLELLKAKLGPEHPVTLSGMHDLALGYRAAGRLDKAIPLFQETLVFRKSKLGPSHPNTLTTMQSLAVSYWSVRNTGMSIPLFEEMLRLQESKFGRDNTETLLTVANLGVNYRDAGRYADGLPLLEEAHRAAAKYPKLQFVGLQLLEGYYRAGKTDRAAGLLNELLAEMRATYSTGTPQLPGQLSTIGQTLLRVRAFAEAEALFRECLTIRETTEPDLWRTHYTKLLLGETLLGQKQYTAAQPLILAGYKGMKEREKTIPPSSRTCIPQALDRLVELYTTLEQPAEVQKWQTERAKYAPSAAPFVPPTKSVTNSLELNTFDRTFRTL